ncbi:MAG: hypothetical protein K6W08_15880 [Firmicutes bacterium]|nr:hypothetical protein [Bacillota bacterium]
MTPPGRQPPPVVPVLTDVVPGLSAAVAPSAPRATPSSAPVAPNPPAAVTEADLDDLTDRILARLAPTLHEDIAEAVQRWLLAHADACARDVGAALRDPLADRIRAALHDILGSTRN